MNDGKELRALTGADIGFLCELRDELNTQDTVCQADPRFWVVRGSRWEPCWEGHAERFSLCEDGERIGELEEYRDHLPGGLTCVPERRVESNEDNTFFMTLRECREHIERNRHHYPADAHPYAMTAWRSPQVGRLWKILQEVDWAALGLEAE